jgi:dolichol-phosphate mannosyltransferase
MNLLITGICGFAASSIPRTLREYFPDWTISGIDNLSRPGSKISRFIKGGRAIVCPTLKLVLNRCATLFLKGIFNTPLNYTRNAFKAYSREVIAGCQPLICPHFDITVELPLKAIVRSYSWTSIPVTWRSQRTGKPKLKLKETGSRYMFNCLCVWVEKHLTCGDHRRR